MDGTLVPHHDRSMSTSSKNYRYSIDLQVVIDADTRLTVAIGRPLPGNRNDCPAYTESGVDQGCVGAHVMADGGYQGSREVLTVVPQARRRHRNFPPGRRNSTRFTSASEPASNLPWHI
ncbi:hypothetical protein GCM10027563_24470 [Parasphingorhabdus pacifica]